MKVLWFLAKVACILGIGVGVAAADSITLRNGRHVQGRYIGGTATMIGFMSGANVEYFATADVLALIFDNSNPDSPISELHPHPMKQRSPRPQQPSARLQRARAHEAASQRVQPRSAVAVVAE